MRYKIFDRKFITQKRFLLIIMIINLFFVRVSFFVKRNIKKVCDHWEEIFLLEVSGLNFKYINVQALNNVNIKVDAGKIVTVFGKVSSGKSTMFKIIAGLMKPDNGDIKYMGNSILKNRHKNLNGKMVCIERHKGLFLGLTVKENLELGAWQIRDKFVLKKRFNVILDLIPNLEKSFNTPAEKLCNGEQMLTLIARSIFSQPDLIVIDEPTFGFYQLFADKILELIRKANRNLGTTFLLMQQSLGEAIKIADWIYELDLGEIVKQGDSKSFEYFDYVDNAEIKTGF